MPDPSLRRAVLSPFDNALFIFRGHPHAIIRRIRRSLSLFPAFCKFFGIYLIVIHDVLLLWNKLLRQQAVGVALDSRATRQKRKFGL